MTQSTYAIIGVCGDKSLVLGANLVIKDETLLLKYARQYRHYRPAFAVRVKKWKQSSEGKD